MSEEREDRGEERHEYRPSNGGQYSQREKNNANLIIVRNDRIPLICMQLVRKRNLLVDAYNLTKCPIIPVYAHENDQVNA